MRVAIVGAGISGLTSAYVLSKTGIEVVLYEKQDYLGSHARTLTFDGTDVDLGSMVFNPVTCSNLILEFLDSLGVELGSSEMSFSVSLEKRQDLFEWGTRNGLSSLLAQKKNVFSFSYWKLLREIRKFKDDVLSYLQVLGSNPAGIERNETLEQFVKSRSYSELFEKNYLIPICSSIWSSPSDRVMSFSAYSVLSFFRNHCLLELFGRAQLLTVKQLSQCYVSKAREILESRGCEIRLGCEVRSVSCIDEGCTVLSEDGSQETYSGCIMAVHAPVALKILGEQATYDEKRILGAFQYVHSDVFLHRDKSLMPQNPAAWSAWNFIESANNRVFVTYWLNLLQNNGNTTLPFLLTVNPEWTPKETLLKWSITNPIPSVAASIALIDSDSIQGKRGIWFCQAYQDFGHQENLKAGVAAAHSMLGRSFAVISNPKHMVPTALETGARLFVTHFLSQFVSTGCITLLEEGGKTFTFQGNDKTCSIRVVLRLHSPLFYWKITTEGDTGLADAYVNGEFSVVDEDNGLLNLLMILIANTGLRATTSNSQTKIGWWTKMVLSTKNLLQRAPWKNSVTRARQKICSSNNLGNQLYPLFLDETKTCSCAIFEAEDENLETAQRRKTSRLIDKAKIDKSHEVLDIGCGFGTLGFEAVKRTGCKYTGITLSKEQVECAEQKVKEAGLQENIRFLSCDFRLLPHSYKYDRIIACEVLEDLGHDNIEQFFGFCEKILAEDGLLVLQFQSTPDELYDDLRLSSGFIKEFLTPVGCYPSLSRIISANMAESRLQMEHVENIGTSYYRTLRCWRKNLWKNHSKVLSLGFDEKFFRGWDYYFIYLSAGYKSQMIKNYQVVFSRLGSTPFKAPSAKC